MREIKFRAWDKEQKKMLNWEQIRHSFGMYWCSHTENGDYVLMQYTGRKDINGKEIYEGDIVEVKEDKHLLALIIWKKGTFMLAWEDGYTTDLNDWWGDEMELIGNIYQDPELLEQCKRWKEAELRQRQERTWLMEL